MEKKWQPKEFHYQQLDEMIYILENFSKNQPAIIQPTIKEWTDIFKSEKGVYQLTRIVKMYFEEDGNYTPEHEHDSLMLHVSAWFTAKMIYKEWLLELKQVLNPN